MLGATLSSHCFRYNPSSSTYASFGCHNPNSLMCDKSPEMPQARIPLSDDGTRKTVVAVLNEIPNEATHAWHAHIERELLRWLVLHEVGNLFDVVFAQQRQIHGLVRKAQFQGERRFDQPPKKLC